jgi:hypothetical protein
VIHVNGEQRVVPAVTNALNSYVDKVEFCTMFRI